MSFLRRSWSPYVGGVLLGVLVTVSMSGLGHRLSGAGAMQQLSGFVGAKLAPSSMYWRHIVPPAIGWDVWVTLGALLARSDRRSRPGRSACARCRIADGRTSSARASASAGPSRSSARS